MPLAATRALLTRARENGYAVPAYDVQNYETMLWVLGAAERLRTPAILMYYPTPYIPFGAFCALGRELAQRASVPVALHLDHCADYDTILRAIAEGFPSVMIDASKQPFEENVRITSEIVRAAHAMGVCVEAELGHVGSGARREDFVDKAMYTDPESAREFCARTGCDSLAVAIGNSHGVYVETPHLDIALLEKLRAAVPVPLVLHGTSGIPDDQLMQAVRRGVCKTNIATEYLIHAARVTREHSAGAKYLGAILEGVYAPMTDFIAQKMRLLNPDQKVLY